MKHPLVSVIIPNYNYERYLGEAIDSALAQTYSNLEIIVVDDGSHDRSLDVARSYGDKIKLIAQKNEGVSAARNNGAAAGRGEFVAFLDADDAWLEEKLERQIELLLRDEKVGFVHCAMTLISPEGDSIGESGAGQAGSVAEEFLLFERGVVVGFASTGVVRRSAFDAVGGFDTRLSTAADWDLCYRLSVEYDLAFVPEPLALYRMHGTNMHGNIRAMEHDMMLGFKKAFDGGASADRRICYANLHLTLAGSYFQAGQYRDFARHAAKSIFKRPSGIAYFLAYPARRSRRRDK